MESVGSVGRDGIGAVVGYTVPVGRLRWLMREFAEAGVLLYDRSDVQRGHFDHAAPCVDSVGLLQELGGRL